MRVVAALGVALVLLACSADGQPTDVPRLQQTAPAPPTAGSPPVSDVPAAREPGVALLARPAGADDVRVGTAWRTVRHLARTVGPRHATSAAHRRAAAWVEDQLETLGYDVTRQSFRVPAGVSWGVPVRAGRSASVVATFGPVDRRRPHVVVGAHLDTVPRAPGAEDNASGVGALLAVAEAVADRPTRWPVVLVAFGAEEPRGPGDRMHHFGSQSYVQRMSTGERAALRAMVSLDRVGVGKGLPVCSAGAAPTPLRDRLLAAAREAGVAAVPCVGNRASDHWSFVRAGLPGVRLGSTPYAAYHSPGDLPAVVERAQLRRAAVTVVAWLSPR